MRTAVFVSLVVSVVLSLPAPAQACACCDGSTKRTPIGWSAAGDEILLDNASHRGCEWTRTLEVWPVHGEAPAGCYDLFGDADKKIACADATSTHRPPKAATSRKARDYAKRAAPLGKDQLLVNRTRAPGDDNIQLIVSVKHGGRWREVWTGVVHSAEQISGGADKPTPAPVRVTVWPSPKGDRALLLVENEDTAPGTGHWDTTVRWVVLPR